MVSHLVTLHCKVRGAVYEEQTGVFFRQCSLQLLQAQHASRCKWRTQCNCLAHLLPCSTLPSESCGKLTLKSNREASRMATRLGGTNPVVCAQHSITAAALQPPVPATAARPITPGCRKDLLHLTHSVAAGSKNITLFKSQKLPNPVGLSASMNSPNGTRKFSGFQERKNFSLQASHKGSSNISAMFTPHLVFLSDFFIRIKSTQSSTGYLRMHNNLIAQTKNSAKYPERRKLTSKWHANANLVLQVIFRSF